MAERLPCFDHEADRLTNERFAAMPPEIQSHHFIARILTLDDTGATIVRDMIGEYGPVVTIPFESRALGTSSLALGHGAVANVKPPGTPSSETTAGT